MTLWTEQELAQCRQALLHWYDHHQRTLPWREVQDPYATWVSEIMLQQTQVATVIDYFNRWMVRFPDVHSLASADLDEVLSMWAGLGYYRRAKLLHKAARYVVEELGGQMPQELKGLLALPGVGRYTAGAIASIAFEQSVPIVDGNVERILARLRTVAGDPKSKDNQKIFWQMAEALVDDERPGDFNQSMMELGATVCTPKKPTCLLCPVRALCMAYAEGDVLSYPAKVKRAKKKKQHVITCIVYAQRDNQPVTLLMQRPEEGLLANMWEFPTVAMTQGDTNEVMASYLASLFGQSVDAQSMVDVGKSKHVFTHIHMTFDVLFLRLDVLPQLNTDGAHVWAEIDDFDGIAVSTAQQKVWRVFQAWSQKS